MCPFVQSGECEIPPCKDCLLSCSGRERKKEPYCHCDAKMERKEDDGE